VTVRITVSEGAPRLIRVEGRLTGDEWPELEQAIGDDPTAVCLDLAGLQGVDAVALAGLRRLRKSGVELRGVPPHLAWRLEDEEA
jgi:anti-anti-sigma regulatory factor